MAAPLTDDEMDAIAEKMLTKLLDRATARALQANDGQRPAPAEQRSPLKRPEARPEDFADVIARRRRRGR